MFRAKFTPFEPPECVQISQIQTYFTGKMSGPANQLNKTLHCKIFFIFKKIFLQYPQNDPICPDLAQFWACFSQHIQWLAKIGCSTPQLCKWFFIDVLFLDFKGFLIFFLK